MSFLWRRRGLNGSTPSRTSGSTSNNNNGRHAVGTKGWADTVDALAKRVICVCRQFDQECTLVYVGRDDGRTIVRIGASEGAASSAVCKFQSSVGSAFPLARTRVVEDIMNGNVMLQVTFPSPSEERGIARARIVRRRPFVFLRVLSLVCVVLGFGFWIQEEWNRYSHLFS